MIVIGTPPDQVGRFARRFGANVRLDSRPVFHGPCTTVVISTGQFRRGLDLVPRGHPGDGRAEVQIYAVPGRQRRELRARLATGTHVPHPEITQRTATRVRVSVDRRVPIEIDGRPVPAADLLEITLVPSAYRLLL
jgi:diacylglycerol kinase family enzyme